MKHIYMTFLIVFLLSSCRQSENSMIFKIENISGLQDNSTVTIDQITIGKIKTFENESLAEIVLNSHKVNLTKIPIDSELHLKDSSKSQKAEFELIFGKSNKFAKSGDTLKWFVINKEELQKEIISGEIIYTSQGKYYHKDSLKE